MIYNKIEIINKSYANYAIIDKRKVEVFENVEELTNDWGFNEFNSDNIEIIELNLIENMCQDTEYFAGDNEYILCWGNGNGEFLVNASEDYTVYVVYNRGFPENYFFTEEAAKDFVNPKKELLALEC